MSEPGRIPAVSRVRVVAADDCVLIRRALDSVLSEADGIDLVALCATTEELRAAIDEHQPDVVLTDIRMPPDMTDDGLRLAVELRETHPAIGVVLLSTYCEPEYAIALLHDGGERRAYLLKERLADVGQLLATIEAVADGHSYVDAKVAQVLLHAANHARQVDD